MSLRALGKDEERLRHRIARDQKRAAQADFGSDLEHCGSQLLALRWHSKRKFNMRSIAVLSVTGLLLMGCNQVKNEPLPLEATGEQTAEIMKKLSEEDQKLLTGFLMRDSVVKAMSGGKGGVRTAEIVTVGDALRAQQKWVDERKAAEAEAEALAAQEKAKMEAAAFELSKAITVALVNTEILPKNYDVGRFSELFYIKLAVQNKTQKEIAGIKGIVSWTDTFGADYFSTGIAIEQKIKPGETYRWEGERELNQFDDDDKKLTRLGEEHKFSFKPMAIVFSDGSRIGLSEDDLNPSG